MAGLGATTVKGEMVANFYSQITGVVRLSILCVSVHSAYWLALCASSKINRLICSIKNFSFAISFPIKPQQEDIQVVFISGFA